METLQTNRRLPSMLIALIVTICAIFCMGTTAAFAADTPENTTTPTETLTVDEVWLTGDTLHVAVTDKTSGGNQTLELNLSDYAKPGDEFVTIQATDSGGRTSNAIQFKNSYYTPPAENADGENAENDGDAANTTAENAEPSESSVSSGYGKPFTPDGAGSVVDNATDGDGKEFFTVETPDGNTFYLIVDRQRNSENVYLLNAVTEDDLNSLAKPGDGINGGTSNSAVDVPEVTPTVTPESTTTPEPTPEPAKSGGNTGMLGILAVVLVVVGGIGYYVKIVRPKKAGYDYENEDDYADAPEDYPTKREEEPDDYTTTDDEPDESEVNAE